MPATTGARPGGDPPTKTSEADGAERFLPAAADTSVKELTDLVSAEYRDRSGNSSGRTQG